MNYVAVLAALTEPTPGSMAAFLADLTTVITQIVTWVGTVCTTIVGTPLLLFSIGFFAIGGAIGIVGRLLSRG